RETIEGQVIQTDIHEKAQPATHFEQHSIRNRGLFLRQFERVKEFRSVLDRQCTNLRQRLATNAHVARSLAQTPAFAIRTDRVAAILRKKDAHMQLVFFGVEPFEESTHAGPLAFAIDKRIPLRSS